MPVLCRPCDEPIEPLWDYAINEWYCPTCYTVVPSHSTVIADSEFPPDDTLET